MTEWKQINEFFSKVICDRNSFYVFETLFFASDFFLSLNFINIRIIFFISTNVRWRKVIIEDYIMTWAEVRNPFNSNTYCFLFHFFNTNLDKSKLVNVFFSVILRITNDVTNRRIRVMQSVDFSPLILVFLLVNLEAY